MPNHLASNSYSLPSSNQYYSKNRLSFSKLRQQILRDNYYERLNISRNATGSQIKKAYFKLIRLIHPDKHHNNISLRHNLTVRLNEAYQCLSDAQQRHKYDTNLNSQSSANSDIDSETDSVGDQNHDDREHPISSNDQYYADMVVNLFKVLHGFDAFKDDLETLYYLRYFSMPDESQIQLRHGFNDYLAQFLHIFNINANDINTQDVSIMHDSALVNITLKPTSCGYLTRSVYVAMPLTLPIKDPDFVKLKYGEEWQGFLSFFNHPFRNVMMHRPLTADKVHPIISALNQYLMS